MKSIKIWIGRSTYEKYIKNIKRQEASIYLRQGLVMVIVKTKIKTGGGRGSKPWAMSRRQTTRDNKW
jgi:hypothetical protein